MVDFPDKSIYLYSDSIDFRKGIKSLSNLINTAYPGSDLKNSLFMFFSKDLRQVKILEVEDDNIGFIKIDLMMPDLYFQNVIRQFR